MKNLPSVYHPATLITLGSMSKARIRHYRPRIAQAEPVPRDARDALIRGTPDEQLDGAGHIARFVAPTAKELVQSGKIHQLMTFAKAQPKVSRRGIAMASLDLGDLGNQSLQLYRPNGISFEQLREVVQRNPILELIIRQRIRQTQRFLRRSKFDWQPGFQLHFKDPSREVRDEDQDRFTWLTNYLMSCGAEFDPRRRRALIRDSLKDFTAKHIRDSLTGDAAPIELVPTVSGRVHGWMAVDMAKIFLTDPNSGISETYPDSWEPEFNELVGRSFGQTDNVIAVYAKDSIVRAAYTHEDLLYPIRNPTSDESAYGYGDAEPERLLQVVTAFLNAFTLNTRSISDNSVPRGILSLMGDFSEEDIEDLRMDWRAQMTGAPNRGRVAIFAAEDPQSQVNFIPTGGELNEQLYARWMTLLVAIQSAMYSIDPNEISFESYSAGGASTLSGSDAEAKITSSQDKGLYTLLNWYGDTLNEVIALVDEDVELEWTGLEISKEESQAREQSIMRWGEVRSRYNLPNDDIPDELLQLPLNPALTSAVQQWQMQQQAQQQGAQPGMPGQPAPEDGQTTPMDPEHPEGPDGERRMQDHEGGVWQVQNEQPQAGMPASQPQGTLQKAQQSFMPDLMWPEGADG